MTRRMGSGRRCSVRSDASLVFTRYSTNIDHGVTLALYMCLLIS